MKIIHEITKHKLHHAGVYNNYNILTKYKITTSVKIIIQ